MIMFTFNPPMNMVSNRNHYLGNVFSTRRCHKSVEYGTEGYRNLRLFSTRSMNDLLKIYGFKVIKDNGGTWGIPFVARLLAKIFPYYGLFTIVLEEKK